MYSITFAWPDFSEKDIEWLKSLEQNDFRVNTKNTTHTVTLGGSRCHEIQLKSEFSITFFNKKYATMFALKYPDTYIIEESYDNS